MKEPSTILFYKRTIYEFTYKKDDEFSQGPMALLYHIPDQQTVAQSIKVKVLASSKGLHVKVGIHQLERKLSVAIYKLNGNNTLSNIV